MTQGERVMVELAGIVPVGTTGVSYNVTATGQTASGFASVFPASTLPGTSTVNWTGPQQTIANGYISKILNDDRILFVEVTSAGTSHIVIDITGYFTPSPSGGITSGTDVFNGAERRIYHFQDPGAGPIPPGGTLKVDVNTGTPPPVVPITAASVNVTVTGTTGSGVLTVAKDESTTTSTINWSGPNQTIANAVITNVAPDGTFTVTNNGTTPALVIVDLTGTFSPVASGANGARYWGMEPTRTYDSRIADGPLPAGQSRITSHPVPVDATAIVMNTTITGTSGTGYLSLGEPSLDLPMTSTANWYTSPTTRANGAIVTTNGHATRAFVGGSNSTQYVTDVGGYFR